MIDCDFSLTLIRRSAHRLQRFLRALRPSKGPMICVILYTLVQVGLSLATLKLSWLERSKDQSEKGSVIARELLHSTTRLTGTSEEKAALLRELLYVPIEEYEVL